MERKAAILTALAGNFDRKLSAELLSMWLDLLEPYTHQEVALAVRMVINEYEYKTLPPFAVLKKALNRITGQGEQSKKEQAMEDWEHLLSEIQSVGSYGQPNLSPEAARAVRMMGGWSTVCSWPRGVIDFKRADFLGLWEHCSSLDYLPEAPREALEIHDGPKSVGDSMRNFLDSIEVKQ
ncbi:MAG: hypothetical protein RBR42_04965 [Desulfomicrobium sp.]|nr:hypothetical protein [Desulfomicrobium sp.]